MVMRAMEVRLSSSAGRTCWMWLGEIALFNSTLAFTCRELCSFIFPEIHLVKLCRCSWCGSWAGRCMFH
jgi:hypothetical protein